MSYKIIVDSCGELSPEMKASGYFATASLSIDVDDYHVIDDETFNQKEFLEKVAASPMPEVFLSVSGYLYGEVPL